MIISGFVLLITVSLANVLTSQAECCKCDCHAPAASLSQSPFYYVPVLPAHGNENQLGIHQQYNHLGGISLENVVQLSQGHATQAGYQYQYTGRYAIPEQGTRENLEVEDKLKQGAADYLDGQYEQQQLLLHSNEQQGHSESSEISDLGVLQQPKISKVSTHQDTHYINIEQHISPHSEGLDEKKDLHGKNDHYKFEYAVNDKKTHDIKQHKEEKKGDVVRGEYSLVEEDGNIRTVKYYADWKSGFHARVHNSKKIPLG